MPFVVYLMSCSSANSSKTEEIYCLTLMEKDLLRFFLGSSLHFGPCWLTLLQNFISRCPALASRRSPWYPSFQFSYPYLSSGLEASSRLLELQIRRDREMIASFLERCPALALSILLVLLPFSHCCVWVALRGIMAAEGGSLPLHTAANGGGRSAKRERDRKGAGERKQLENSVRSPVLRSSSIQSVLWKQGGYRKR